MTELTHEVDEAGQFCKHCGVGMGMGSTWLVSMALCPVRKGYTVPTATGWVKPDGS